MATQKVRLYHNPRCSKSREVLALLRERGIEPEIVDYLKTPPSADEVEALLATLGVAPHGLVRTKESAYAASGLGPNSTAREVADAIAREPVLLERPVVVVGQKGAIGRPVENVLALF
ncbi:MAG: arsenate reductase (glutaredoxin) [Polyangiales bacterium]